MFTKQSSLLKQNIQISRWMILPEVFYSSFQIYSSSFTSLPQEADLYGLSTGLPCPLALELSQWGAQTEIREREENREPERPPPAVRLPWVDYGPRPKVSTTHEEVNCMTLSFPAPVTPASHSPWRPGRVTAGLDYPHYFIVPNVMSLTSL